MLAADCAALRRQLLPGAALAISFATGAAVLWLTLRRQGWRKLRKPEGGQEWRLGIVTSFELGNRRRLWLIRRDNTEHLVVTGGRTDALLGTALADRSSAELAEGGEGWPQGKEPDEPFFALARPFIEAAKRLTTAAEGLVPLALLSGAAGAGA